MRFCLCWMPGMLLAGILRARHADGDHARRRLWRRPGDVCLPRDDCHQLPARGREHGGADRGARVIFTAASALFVGATIAYLPQRLVDLLAHGRRDGRLSAISSIALLIFVGVPAPEGLPSLNVLAPLLLPIAVKLGFSGLHFAIVLIVAMSAVSAARGGFAFGCAMRCDVDPLRGPCCRISPWCWSACWSSLSWPWLTLALSGPFRISCG